MTLSARAGATVTPAGAVTDVFEVATDTAFSHVVTAKSVQETGAPIASVRLEVLVPGTIYYWHVRSRAANTVGDFSPTASFTLGPAETIDAPAPIQQALQGPRPTLTVRNATRAAPTNSLTYQFDVASNSDFTPVLLSGVVAEGTGQTSFVPSADLAPGATFFWRARSTRRGA